MKIVPLTLLFVMVVLRALPQEMEVPRLPQLFLFKYKPATRDPFISPQATRTLFSAENNVGGVVSGRIVTQYLRTITQAIQRELFVEGLSTGDQQSRAMAIINGVTFAEGDKIPLPVPADVLLQLDALARTYGLPLQKNREQANSILIEVGRIETKGVKIVLPGFQRPLCELPYQGDNIPDQIQLERRPPAH